MTIRKYQRLILVGVFLLTLLALFQFSGLRQHLSLQYVHDTLLANKVSGLLAFALLFALGNLIQIPGWVFLGAAVLALGKLWGGVTTYLAACFSCCSTFVLIRLLGGDALRKLDSTLAKRILAHLDQRPVLSIALLRLLFQTVPALNYALSMSGVRFRHYLVGTLLGLPLPIALYCVFFDYLGKALHVT